MTWIRSVGFGVTQSEGIGGFDRYYLWCVTSTVVKVGVKGFDVWFVLGDGGRVLRRVFVSVAREEACFDVALVSDEAR